MMRGMTNLGMLEFLLEDRPRTGKDWRNYSRIPTFWQDGTKWTINKSWFE